MLVLMRPKCECAGHKSTNRSADGELRGTTDRADSRLIPSIVVLMKHLDRWRFESGSSLCSDETDVWSRRLEQKGKQLSCYD